MTLKVSSFVTKRKHINTECAGFRVFDDNRGWDDEEVEQELVFTNTRQQVMAEIPVENENEQFEMKHLPMEEIFPDGREPWFSLKIANEAPCMTTSFVHGFSLNLKKFTGYIFISKCYSDAIYDISKEIDFFKNSKGELIMSLPQEDGGYQLFFYTYEVYAFNYFYRVENFSYEKPRIVEAR